MRICGCEGARRLKRERWPGDQFQGGLRGSVYFWKIILAQLFPMETGK